MLMCGCTSDVETLSPSEEQVSPQQCGYEDAFVEHDSDDNSLMDGENETTSDIAKSYLDRISEELAALDEKKKRQPLRSSSLPTKMGDRVFRTDPPSPNTRYPSIKHNSSESTQSTTSLSFDEEDEPHHDDGHEQQPKIVSILRRTEKMAPIRIEATGAGVRFSPSTVFPEATSKRKPVRRKPRVQAVPVTYTDDELRRIERRSQQNQYNDNMHIYSPYLSHDMRSPSSELLYPTESFYVFR